MQLTINRYKFKPGSRVRRCFTAIVFFLPVALSAACSQSPSERAAQVGGITAKQIIENPAAYVGKTVTVSGEVEAVYGPRAFNMDSGVSLGELLVVGREPFPNLTDADNRSYLISDVATVTGVVRMLVKEDIEREIGWNLDPQIVVTYTSKPVLVAQSTNFKPVAGRGDATVPADGMNDGQMTANTNKMPPMANNNRANSSGAMMTDIGVYASTTDKTSLVGKTVKFTDIKVVRVVGPRTFTVASGNDEIYVMLADESARGVGTQGRIDIGDTVSVTGDFERLNSAEINDIKNNRFRPLTETERAFLKKTKVFLQANQVSGGK